MVIFRNLLEPEVIDLNYGYLSAAGMIYCLCGCGGTFEKCDYYIICSDANVIDDNGLPKIDEPIIMDETVNKVDMHEYGYHWDYMCPLEKEKARELYLEGHEIYRIYPDDTEGCVMDLEDLESHNGLFGIEVFRKE